MMFLANLLLVLQGIVVPPQDSQGWTIIPQSPDTTEIYVSSSTGNNTWPGTMQQPVKSINEAMNRVDDNSADHILLKCGDVWPDQIGFTKRGKSFQEPIIITSYGQGPRPLIGSPTQGGAFGNNWGSGYGLKNLWLVGLKFQGSGSVDNNIVSFMDSSENVLMEDCDVKGGNLGTGGPGGGGFCLVLDGTNFIIRRNIFHEADQGIYEGWESDFILLEQNYFFNFWDTNFNNWHHATYFDNENMVGGHQPTILFNENVVGNVEHTGLQARCSANIINNTVFHCGVGMSLGGSNDYPEGCGYVHGDIIDNVVLHGTTYSTPWALSWGFATNACDGVNFNGNIIANNDIASGMDIASPRAISLYGVQLALPQYPHGVRNLTMMDNIIYNWGADFQDYSTGITANLDTQYCWNIKIDGLDIQEPIKNDWLWDSSKPGTGYPTVQTSHMRLWGNPLKYGIAGGTISFGQLKSEYHDTSSQEVQVQYRFPQLSIPLYNQIVCGGQPSFDDFIAKCEQQRKGNWKLEYTSENINSTFRRAFTAQ